MRRRYQLLAAGLVVLCLALGASYSPWHEATPQQPVIAQTGIAQESANLEKPAAADLDSKDVPIREGDLLPLPPDGSVREEAGAEGSHSFGGAAFSGALVNEEGQPIEGAQLSWTHYPVDFFSATSWREVGPWWIDDDWYSEHTVWAQSGPKGTFSFAEAPDPSGSNPSVLWATAQDYGALCIQMEPEHKDWANGISHVMDNAPQVKVRVIDGQGIPVHGATVVELAPSSNAQPFLEAASSEDTARVFLRRRFDTDQTGRAVLAAIGGRIRIQASKGDATSQSWTGVAGPDVELVLTPSFLVKGELTINGGGGPYDGEVSVVIRAWEGSSFRTVDRVLVGDDPHSWGPVRVPLSGAERYSFHLDSTTVVPRTQFLPAPSPGEEITVDFESSVGNELWFVLMNPDGEYLTEGMIEIFWEGADEQCSLSRRPRSDGYVRILNCPTGTLTRIRGSSPGYTPLVVPGRVIPDTDPHTGALVLQPAGRISGRCVAGGEPVPDFEVVLWGSEDTTQPYRLKVDGSIDGSFVITEAALGEVQILASSPLHGESLPLAVRVVEGELAQVELELLDSTIGAGRVVDDTGTPIANATVQPFFQNGRLLIAKKGLAIAVDLDGRFDLAELAPGQVGFKVAAPGYSTTDHWAQVTGGEPVDFGDIQLSPLVDLEVYVEVKGNWDPTACDFYVDSTSRDRTQALSSDGTTFFEGVDTSAKRCGMRLPDDSWISFKLPRRRAERWTANFSVGGTGSIVVDISSDNYEGKLPSTARAMLAKYNDKHEASLRALSIPETGEVIFEGVSPGEYMVRVAESYVRVYGATRVSVTEGETAHATIDFLAEPTALRIIDKHGDPLPGVAISLYASDYPLWRRAVSDSSGLCTISGTTPMDAFVGLQHPQLGNLWGIPLRLGQGMEKIITIEFAPDSELLLRLVDGETPLAGISCRLNATDNRRVDIGHPVMSDSQGKVRYDSLGAASYGVDFRAPHIWDAEHSFELTPSGTPRTVQLRRTGSARLEVTTLTGQAVAGASIELYYEELAVFAQAWAAEGLIQPLPANFTTAADGTLLVPSIPRGRYSWRAVGPNGGEQSGVLRVPASGEVIVPIRMP